ncbi:MAG: ribonuclease P/MRP protein subunit [Amphiamblys sp. WSBS2006]|nr:MAG: ribonuclease P/MRP protein subunit [Amphiamblys sp. WSBS2006]
MPSIDAVDYAEARKNEISFLHRKIAEQNKRKKRMLFQRLPRSLRRRTASYLPKRVPRRFRDRAPAEGCQKPKKKSCRRKRRRQKEGLVEEKMNAEEGRWLETHLWHAKRMRMETLWNHRIAVSSTDKTFKRTLKKGLEDCSIHDESYVQCVALGGERKDIEELLGKFLGGCTLSPHVSSHGVFQTENETVSEVYFCYLEKQVWMWVHCSAFSDVFHLLDNNKKDVHIRKIQAVSQIGLYGPNADERLCSVVRLADRQGHVLSKKEEKEFLSSKKQESVFAGRCIDPRLGFPMYSSDHGEGQAAHGLDDSSIMSEELRRESKEKKTSEGEINKRREKNEVPGTGLSYRAGDETVPVMILKKGFGSTRERFSVVVPAGWGMVFWRCFVYQRVGVCGQRDIRQLGLELGIPQFPFDYAGTKAQQEYTSREKALSEGKELSKPPGKRTNYTKNGIENPFSAVERGRIKTPGQSNSSEKDGVLFIEVVSVSKGVPKEHARIYLPEDTECSDRSAVGRVTSGGYSHTRGRGFGLGVLTQPSLFPPLERKDTIRIRFRNICSKICFDGEMCLGRAVTG